MLNPSPISDPVRPPSSSAWTVYRRLLGYAWNYKGRLMVSLLFALVIAASFGAMLLSVGTVVKLTFYEPPAVVEGGEIPTDPAVSLANDVRAYSDTLEARIGWAPQDLDIRLLALVDDMRADKMRALTLVCMLVLILSILVGLARFLQEYFAGAIGANISSDLGEAMYANLMRQSLGFFEKRHSGDILARFTNDIFMVNRGLSGVFVKLLREPFKIVTFLAIAIAIDPWLTMIGLCVLPPVAYALIKLGKKVRRSTRKSLEKIASMAGVVNETVHGIAIVKGYCMEEYETGRVRVEIGKLRRFLKKMVRADAATGPITEFVLIVGVVIFVLFSGHRVASGHLDAGDLVQLYFALAMMLDPVRKLSSVNNMIQISVASAERVFEFLDMVPAIDEKVNAKHAPPLQDALCFENVTFSYDGREPVLKNINLRIAKGEMVALVGFSGAGKSTLVKLIPRFYDVSEGRVTLDGVDIRELRFASLRGQISIVTQDNILFAESVRANISFGKTSFSEERVREAARAAHADEFIDALPQGYDTVLGESGATLSGGQRQRLAIARAIINDPAILILDEATSSLDSRSEQLIQAALDEFVEGRTAIVIAHRLSTIQRADRIVVLHEGEIAEIGPHRELIAQNGLYQKLYETQFGQQRDASE